MNKIALLLTSLLISGLMVVKVVDVPIEERINWMEHDQKVRALTFRYQCFKEILEAAIENLENDRVDLQTAQGRVEAASRIWYPEYLEYLGWAEPGATDERRVARNLVDHVSSVAAIVPKLTPRARSLESEFKRIYGMTATSPQCKQGQEQ